MRSLSELRLLEFEEVRQHIVRISGDLKDDGCYFETYFTEHHFIYNIHVLKIDQSVHRYLISEPMIVQPYKEQAIHDLCDQRRCTVSAKLELSRTISDVPVVSWRRIHQLGLLLNRMCGSLPEIRTIHQPSREAHQDLSDPSAMSRKIDRTLLNQLEMPILGDALYLKIKGIIQSGNISALPDIDHIICFDDIPFHCFGSTDFLRIVKDYFIILCTMQLYCAIDAGLPFSDMQRLAEHLISESEQMNQVSEIFAQMKVSLATFIHAVHQYQSQRYSKPVLSFLAYIRAHYTEHITLEAVSAHVGLNPNYLSNLVKKETGMSLADHINRTRIEASKHDLQHSNRPVNEIAQSVGFAYQSHYARLFRKFMGMSPVAFRDQKVDDVALHRVG